MRRIRNAIAAMIVLLAIGCGQQKQTSDAEPQSSSKTRQFASVPDQPVSNPFPTAPTVRLFVETEYRTNDNPAYSKSGGHLLSADERLEFEALLKIRTPDPNEPVIGCFIPHHFFRYYDAVGKIVGEIAVCFCCGGVEASGAFNIAIGNGQELDADLSKLETFVRKLGEPTDVLCRDDI